MEKKLGLTALTALVFSSMFGAGAFSLPQNMAAVASPAAVLIGWTITGVGILFLAATLLVLSRLRPDLDGGVFTYAREGFGELMGFCSAWGYWLCAVIANLSYLVIVFAALSFFTDSPDRVIFGDGNTLASMLGASLLLWIVHFLVLKGVQTASIINLVATIIKLLPLVLFILLAIAVFKLDTFKLDFAGASLGQPIWQQVKDTMLITVWVFIGIEGAIVVSARARNKNDVGRATMLAVFSALVFYLLIILLSLGIVPRDELAKMHNPSMAILMTGLMGHLGQIIIVIGLIISVCGAYLSWTIMAAEVPFLSAHYGAFPQIFTRQNNNHSPSASLWLTNGSIQVALLLIWLTGSNYNSLLTIASEMILVPYFLVGAFLLQQSIQRCNLRQKLLGSGACIYGLWLLYASGLDQLLLSVLLYAPGLLLFLYARHQHTPALPPLRRREKVIMLGLLFTTLPALWIIMH